MSAPDDPAEPALARLYRVGGAPALERLLTLFLDRTPERLLGAREALRAGDHERLLEAAYSLRSTSALVGADRIFLLAEQLAEAAQQRNTEGMDGVLAAMDDELSTARAGWAQWLGR